MTTNQIPWTRFMDMHSGGGAKEDQEYILIQAPEAQAKVIFYNRFGHNPERVTCTCCGEDYSIEESPTLEMATAYDRNCKYRDGSWVEEPGDLRYLRYGRKYQTVEEYIKSPNVLLIRHKDIKPDERVGDVPQQGYVWQ